MPIARFKMPDGRVARFQVPEGTTPEQAQSMMAAQLPSLMAHPGAINEAPEQENELARANRALFAAQKAGDKEAAKEIGGAIQNMMPEKSLGEKVGQQFSNILGGAVRGAGSIGATILHPLDAEARKKNRADIDKGMKELLGADPESIGYGAGKMGAEILGTLGAGGVLGKAAGALGAAPGVVNALRTAGTAGPNLATRAAAGAATGAAMNAMLDPSQGVGTGAVIGGALPVVGAGLSAVGRSLGSKASPELRKAVQAAQESGYVIQPGAAGANLPARIAEGVAGKAKTAQAVSAKNQAVTDKLAAQAIGLPADAPITPDALNAVRKEASKAYEALANLPAVPARKADSVLGVKASPGFDPKQALLDLRQARNDAQAHFTHYARSGAPDAQTAANAATAKAKQLETDFVDYARSLGRDDLVQKMVDARTLIAKTHAIEKALNPATGTVNAKELAKQMQKGKPLSEELKSIAEFAARFPKAAQVPEAVGGAQVISPLDTAFGGALAAATANPAAAFGMPVARNAAASAVTSNALQRRMMANPQPGNNALVQYLRRVAPVAGSSGGKRD